MQCLPQDELRTAFRLSQDRDALDNQSALRRKKRLAEGFRNQLILGSFAAKVGKDKPVQFPTPWNQLETGILFALAIPLLVFRETGISPGGVFDTGVTDLFIHPMPKPDLEYNEMKALRAVFQRWIAQVSAHYYGET